jgi:hypothetical protein
MPLQPMTAMFMMSFCDAIWAADKNEGNAPIPSATKDDDLMKFLRVWSILKGFGKGEKSLLKIQ